MADDDTLQAEQWKRRYYDGLEQLDKREKVWARTEDLLRHAISRLTLAAEGLDERLDDQLVAVRNAFRDKTDSSVLHQRVEAMSETLLRLEQKKKSTRTAKPVTPSLTRLLDRLDLPKGLGRKTKALREHLADIPMNNNIDPLLNEFAGLLQEAFTLLDASAGSTSASAGTGNEGGILRKLFGKSPSTAAKVDAPGAVTAPSAPSAPSAPNTPVSLQEMLLQLLERLSLPAELAPRVDAIKIRLEEVESANDWARILEDIAGLIAEMRNLVQKEQREIEDFLQQLTDRLQELDLNLQGAQEVRSASQQDGAALNQTVQDHVREIETSVRDATSISELKQSVQQRLDALRGHLKEYRNTEDQRQQQMGQQLETLTSRLSSLENEATVLRQRISIEHSQALLDTLTGIPNRLAYQERSAQELARWKRFKTPLSLFVWDVDNFKRINDTYGHKAGDKVLVTIAQLLQQQIRETDFLARYGGEEFIMLASGADLTAARELAEKLRQAVATCGFHFRNDSVPITISCGISEFRNNDTPEQVFERADKAMYRAKQGGRNQVVCDK